LYVAFTFFFLLAPRFPSPPHSQNEEIFSSGLFLLTRDDPLTVDSHYYLPDPPPLILFPLTSRELTLPFPLSKGNLPFPPNCCGSLIGIVVSFLPLPQRAYQKVLKNFPSLPVSTFTEFPFCLSFSHLALSPRLQTTRLFGHRCGQKFSLAQFVFPDYPLLWTLWMVCPPRFATCSNLIPLPFFFFFSRGAL